MRGVCWLETLTLHAACCMLHAAADSTGAHESTGQRRAQGNCRAERPNSSLHAASWSCCCAARRTLHDVNSCLMRLPKTALSMTTLMASYCG